MKILKKLFRKYLLLLVVIIIAGFVGWIYVRQQAPKETITSYEACVAAGNPVQGSSPAKCYTPDGKNFTQPVDKPLTKVKIKGKTVCLPQKDTSGPQLMMCLYGLQAEDGKYYGLSYNDSSSQSFSSTPTGKTVIVEGNFIEQPDSRYDMAGVIEVTSFQ